LTARCFGESFTFNFPISDKKDQMKGDAVRLTPNILLVVARVLILVIPITLIFGLIGLEVSQPNLVRALLDEPLVNCGFGFIYSLIFYVAFPRMRRGELTVMALAVLVAANLPLAYLDLETGMSAAFATILGGLAALAPGMIERWRHLLRSSAYKTFSEIAEDDRRKTKGAYRLRLMRQRQSLG